MRFGLVLSTFLVFAVCAVQAQPTTYHQLHDFGGKVVNSAGATVYDGANPEANISIDAQGNLWGTTSWGGVNGGDSGNLWKLTSAGAYIDMHDFGGYVKNASGASVVDGASPVGPVTFDKAGDVFGTASSGGTATSYAGGQYPGVVWEFTASGVYVVLHNFGGKITNADGKSGPDGWNPNSGVKFDAEGNMYGTTSAGGPNTVASVLSYAFGSGDGIVWEITAAGVYRDIHDFGGTVTNTSGKTELDGLQPGYAGVAIDASGNLYGTTTGGGQYGAYNGGIVWKVSTTGVYTDLHDFGGTTIEPGGEQIPDGKLPYAGVTVDSSGDFFGTTFDGGNTGEGSVWEITSTGTYRVLHSFGGTITYSDGKTGEDGINPIAGVTVDSSGNLYGTTSNGGQNSSGGPGMIWRLSASGTYKDLYDFLGGFTDGYYPYAGVTLDGAGNLYGVCQSGGPNGLDGVLWSISSGLSSVAVSPVTIIGGSSVTGTLTLSGPAAEAAVVQVRSSSASATAPVSVQVPAGQTSVTFPITTTPVTTQTAVTFKATYAGASDTANLTINAPALAAFSLSPTSVIGGSPSVGTVTLSGPAPTGGTTVSLESSSTSLTVPVSIFVPAGKTAATFSATTTPVTVNAGATVTATLGSVSKSATVSIAAALLSQVTAPSATYGGASLTATAILTGPAPSGGIVLALSVSNSASAGVPASVTVPSGKSSVTFTVTTSPVNAATSETVTAKAGGVSKGAIFTIEAPVLSSFTGSSSAVVGGVANVTITATLNAAAGPAGVTIALTASPSAAVTLSSATITIPSGQTTGAVTAVASAVTANTTCTVTGTLASVKKTVTFTDDSATVKSLTLSPTTVVGGSANSTGTVTLNGPAGPGGNVVTLASTNTSAATVPANVTVAAGQTTATFTITTKAVKATATANITAKLGNTGSAILTVKS